jgi:hypothetical protein
VRIASVVRWAGKNIAPRLLPGRLALVGKPLAKMVRTKHTTRRAEGMATDAVMILLRVAMMTHSVSSMLIDSRLHVGCGSSGCRQRIAEELVVYDPQSCGLVAEDSLSFRSRPPSTRRLTFSV